MQNERDAAISTLHQHGISFSDETFTDIQTLRAQNEELRHTIKLMRVELEQLSDLSVLKAEQSAPAANYVHYMEEEVRKVKADNRNLVEQLQQGLGASQRKPPTPLSGRPRKAKQLSPLKHSHTTSEQQEQQESAVEAKHRDHLIALSDTIASLQREKGELENRDRDWQRKVDTLEQRRKDQEEMVMQHIIVNSEIATTTSVL